MQFDVYGPYEVPVERLQYGQIISRDLSNFWKNTDAMKDKCGCYVFGLRNGGGLTPYYVGKSVKSNFGREAFNARNLAHVYLPCTLDNRGTPVMFFVSPKANANKKIQEAIGDIEKFFISYAAYKNESVYNKHHSRRTVLLNKDCCIKGVIHSSGQGKWSKSAKSFCEMMGID